MNFSEQLYVLEWDLWDVLDKLSTGGFVSMPKIIEGLLKLWDERYGVSDDMLTGITRTVVKSTMLQQPKDVLLHRFHTLLEEARPRYYTAARELQSLAARPPPAVPPGPQPTPTVIRTTQWRTTEVNIILSSDPNTAAANVVTPSEPPRPVTPPTYYRTTQWQTSPISPHTGVGSSPSPSSRPSTPTHDNATPPCDCIMQDVNDNEGNNLGEQPDEQMGSESGRVAKGKGCAADLFDIDLDTNMPNSKGDNNGNSEETPDPEPVVSLRRGRSAAKPPGTVVKYKGTQDSRRGRGGGGGGGGGSKGKGKDGKGSKIKGGGKSKAGGGSKSKAGGKDEKAGQDPNSKKNQKAKQATPVNDDVDFQAFFTVEGIENFLKTLPQKKNPRPDPLLLPDRSVLEVCCPDSYVLVDNAVLQHRPRCLANPILRLCSLFAPI